MPSTILHSMSAVAAEVARALVRVTEHDGAVRISLPLLYPGGSMVGVELSRLRDGFLVSDAGGARREAGLLGGEKAFGRIAPGVAEKFSVRFDSNMIFDIDVPDAELVVAVVAVANAARTSVENTAIHQQESQKMHVVKKECSPADSTWRMSRIFPASRKRMGSVTLSFAFAVEKPE